MDGTDEALRPPAPSTLVAARQIAATALPSPPQAVPAPSPRANAGQSIKDCAECPEMVVIPAGSFRMGSAESENDWGLDRGPVHEVRIRYRLAVGKYEVTRGEFRNFVSATGYRTEAEKSGGCMSAGPSKTTGFASLSNEPGRIWRSPEFEQTDRHPVVCVSWNDTQKYLEWLNGKNPGKGYRLLSEAEWEYVARAGQGNSRYPWGDDPNSSEQCAYVNGADVSTTVLFPVDVRIGAPCSDGYAFTAPVDALKASAFGLHHVHGNVWEWLQDTYHASYRGAPTDGSAWTQAGDPALRVLRGGSWLSTLRDHLRSDFRVRSSPDFRIDDIGFRIARTL